MYNDPMIDGIYEVLAESLDEIRRGVAGLSVEELNARPAGGDTNSIAVIVTHALGSTLSWLSLAVGAPSPPRDRDAEFRTVADDAFAAKTEAMTGRCLAVLEGATWDASRAATPDWNPHLAKEPRTAAYAATHALEHLGEHVGHLHLTRDLLRSVPPPA
jgi:uncharacterized damage-inducible protein DinB